MTNFDSKPEFLKGLRIFCSVVIAFLMILFACVMCGCKSAKYIPVETVRTEYVEADTSEIYNHIQKLFEAQKEKVQLSDSLVDNTQEKIVLNEQGDTVRVYNTRYIYRSSNSDREWEQKAAWYDSVANELKTQLQAERMDSIQQPIVIQEPAETKKSFAQRFFEGLVLALEIPLIVCLLILLIKWIIKKIKK